MPGQTLYM